MAPLPSQVLRPLREAMDARRSNANRRGRVDVARQQLENYRHDLREWMQSVDAMLRQHGEPDIDKLNALQADAFFTRLTDAERRALAKCQGVRAAIAYGEMALEWLDWSLVRGN